MSDGDREQDVERRHRRRPTPSVETEELLDRYRAAMRAELDDLLEEIRPATGQLGAFDGAVTRPPLDDRRPRWDLAIKLARELAGSPSEPLQVEPTRGADPRAARQRPAPRLTVAARRALGG